MPESITTVPESDPILAWHLARDEGLAFHRPDLPLTEGTIVTARGPISLCQHGPHASVALVDAVAYSHGFHLSRVACWGKVIHDANGDKFVATHRRHDRVWSADVVRPRFAAAALDLLRAHLTAGDERAVLDAIAAHLDGSPLPAISDADLTAAENRANADYEQACLASAAARARGEITPAEDTTRDDAAYARYRATNEMISTYRWLARGRSIPLFFVEILLLLDHAGLSARLEEIGAALLETPR